MYTYTYTHFLGSNLIFPGNKFNIFSQKCKNLFYGLFWDFKNNVDINGINGLNCKVDFELNICVHKLHYLVYMSLKFKI